MGEAHRYEFYEPLSWFWQTAGWDVCKQQVANRTKQMTRNNKAEAPDDANWTPWIIILLDFCYCTGIPVHRQNGMRKVSLAVNKGPNTKNK